jgi:hypothetical protein
MLINELRGASLIFDQLLSTFSRCARRVRPALKGAKDGVATSFTAKQTGPLSLVPAGVSPPLRSLSDFELVVCALACGIWKTI